MLRQFSDGRPLPRGLQTPDTNAPQPWPWTLPNARPSAPSDLIAGLEGDAKAPKGRPHRTPLLRVHRPDTALRPPPVSDKNI